MSKRWPTRISTSGTSSARLIRNCFTGFPNAISAATPLGQFIVADGFSPLIAEGAFAKSALDPEFVAQRKSAHQRLPQAQAAQAAQPADPRISPAGSSKRWEKAENGPAEASRTDPPSTADASEVKPQILFLDDDPDPPGILDAPSRGCLGRDRGRVYRQAGRRMAPGAPGP